MNVLDLFSGIGGFSLGLERAGMRTVAFCEIDPFCRKVLAKHWPQVPCYDDIRDLTADRLRADGIAADIISGGFPCQDISTSGHKIGISGSRSGLWGEYARLVRDLRPRFIIVENVAALLARGLDQVLGDLAEIGYDAEWQCVSGPFVGAPQLRDRTWIVAYPQGVGPQADIEKPRIFCAEAIECARSAGHRRTLHAADSEGDLWPIEPALVRVADGFPGRVDRISALGNSVLPQIPEIIGRAIMRAAE
jgi:DNA (cytosine-5)-methyltransferase 1